MYSFGARVGGYGFRRDEGDKRSAWDECRMNGMGVFGTRTVRGALFVEGGLDLYFSETFPLPVADDLPTRLDLADGFIERLRAAGVLFDRSAAGDFLHIYTEGGEQGFFFEIVQRIGGYDAYGAANAAARMAAQAQQS